MRVVLDSNVLLSGMFTRGVCEGVLDACLASDECTLVLSRHILDEFARHARTTFGAPSSEIRRAVEFLRGQAEMVEPNQVASDACPDPDDLPVLGTALAGRADCLVTGDKELLALKRFRSVTILSPRAFYQALR